MNNLIKILEASVNKNGKDTPLTLGHLLNICKLVKSQNEKDEIKEDEVHRHALASCTDPYGNGD